MEELCLNRRTVWHASFARCLMWDDNEPRPSTTAGTVKIVPVPRTLDKKSVNTKKSFCECLKTTAPLNTVSGPNWRHLDNISAVLTTPYQGVYLGQQESMKIVM